MLELADLTLDRATARIQSFATVVITRTTGPASASGRVSPTSGRLPRLARKPSPRPPKCSHLRSKRSVRSGSPRGRGRLPLRRRTGHPIVAAAWELRKLGAEAAAGAGGDAETPAVSCLRKSRSRQQSSSKCLLSTCLVATWGRRSEMLRRGLATTGTMGRRKQGARLRHRMPGLPRLFRTSPRVAA